MSQYIPKMDQGGMLRGKLDMDKVNDSISKLNLSKSDELALRNRVSDIDSSLNNNANNLSFGNNSYSFTGPDAQRFSGGTGQIDENKWNGRLKIQNDNDLNDLAFGVYKNSSSLPIQKNKVYFQHTTDSNGVSVGDWKDEVSRTLYGGNSDILSDRLGAFKKVDDKKKFIADSIKKAAQNYLDESKNNPNALYSNTSLAQKIIGTKDWKGLSDLELTNGIDLSKDLDVNTPPVTTANKNKIGNNTLANTAIPDKWVQAGFTQKMLPSHMNTDWLTQEAYKNNYALLHNPNNDHYALIDANGEPVNWINSQRFTPNYGAFVYHTADENGVPWMRYGVSTINMLNNDPALKQLIGNDQYGGVNSNAGVGLKINWDGLKDKFNGATLGQLKGLKAIGWSSDSGSNNYKLDNTGRADIGSIVRMMDNTGHTRYKFVRLPNGKYQGWDMSNNQRWGDPINLPIQGETGVINRPVNPVSGTGFNFNDIYRIGGTTVPNGYNINHALGDASVALKGLSMVGDNPSEKGRINTAYQRLASFIRSSNFAGLSSYDKSQVYKAVHAIRQGANSIGINLGEQYTSNRPNTVLTSPLSNTSRVITKGANGMTLHNGMNVDQMINKYRPSRTYVPNSISNSDTTTQVLSGIKDASLLFSFVPGITGSIAGAVNGVADLASNIHNNASMGTILKDAAIDTGFTVADFFGLGAARGMKFFHGASEGAKIADKAINAFRDADKLKDAVVAGKLREGKDLSKYIGGDKINESILSFDKIGSKYGVKDGRISSVVGEVGKKYEDANKAVNEASRSLDEARVNGLDIKPFESTLSKAKGIFEDVKKDKDVVESNAGMVQGFANSLYKGRKIFDISLNPNWEKVLKGASKVGEYGTYAAGISAIPNTLNAIANKNTSQWTWNDLDNLSNVMMAGALLTGRGYAHYAMKYGVENHPHIVANIDGKELNISDPSLVKGFSNAISKHKTLKSDELKNAVSTEYKKQTGQELGDSKISYSYVPFDYTKPQLINPAHPYKSVIGKKSAEWMGLMKKHTEPDIHINEDHTMSKDVSNIYDMIKHNDSKIASAKIKQKATPVIANTEEPVIHNEVVHTVQNNTVPINNTKNPFNGIIKNKNRIVTNVRKNSNHIINNIKNKTISSVTKLKNTPKNADGGLIFKAQNGMSTISLPSSYTSGFTNQADGSNISFNPYSRYKNNEKISWEFNADNKGNYTGYSNTWKDAVNALNQDWYNKNIGTIQQNINNSGSNYKIKNLNDLKYLAAGDNKPGVVFESISRVMNPTGTQTQNKGLGAGAATGSPYTIPEEKDKGILSSAATDLSNNVDSSVIGNTLMYLNSNNAASSFGQAQKRGILDSIYQQQELPHYYQRITTPINANAEAQANATRTLAGRMANNTSDLSLATGERLSGESQAQGTENNAMAQTAQYINNAENQQAQQNQNIDKANNQIINQNKQIVAGAASKLGQVDATVANAKNVNFNNYINSLLQNQSNQTIYNAYNDYSDALKNATNSQAQKTLDYLLTPAGKQKYLDEYNGLAYKTDANGNQVQQDYGKQYTFENSAEGQQYANAILNAKNAVAQLNNNVETKQKALASSSMLVALGLKNGGILEIMNRRNKKS